MKEMAEKFYSGEQRVDFALGISLNQKQYETGKLQKMTQLFTSGSFLNDPERAIPDPDLTIFIGSEYLKRPVFSP